MKLLQTQIKPRQREELIKIKNHLKIVLQELKISSHGTN